MCKRVVLTWKLPGPPPGTGRMLLLQAPFSLATFQTQVLPGVPKAQPSPRWGSSHPVLRAWAGPEATRLGPGSQALVLGARRPLPRTATTSALQHPAWGPPLWGRWGEAHPAAGQAEVPLSVLLPAHLCPGWAQVLFSEPLPGAGSWPTGGPRAITLIRLSRQPPRVVFQNTDLTVLLNLLIKNP